MRELPIWVGKTDETAAPARVKVRIVLRQNGICACGCGQKLGAAGERIEFDHTTALVLGGSNDENNLRALRRPCHRLKTNADVAQKSTEARKRAKHLGIKTPKRPMPGSRASGWKRRLDGTVVLRGE